jgi:hypothetical protein
MVVNAVIPACRGGDKRIVSLRSAWAYTARPCLKERDGVGVGNKLTVWWGLLKWELEKQKFI